MGRAVTTKPARRQALQIDMSNLLKTISSAIVYDRAMGASIQNDSLTVDGDDVGR